MTDDSGQFVPTDGATDGQALFDEVSESPLIDSDALKTATVGELVELQARVNNLVKAHTWTDVTEHDPGITLLDALG